MASKLQRVSPVNYKKEFNLEPIAKRPVGVLPPIILKPSVRDLLQSGSREAADDFKLALQALREAADKDQLRGVNSIKLRGPEPAGGGISTGRWISESKNPDTTGKRELQIAIGTDSIGRRNNDPAGTVKHESIHAREEFNRKIFAKLVNKKYRAIAGELDDQAFRTISIPSAYRPYQMAREVPRALIQAWETKPAVFIRTAANRLSPSEVDELLSLVKGFKAILPTMAKIGGSAAGLGLLAYDAAHAREQGKNPDKEYGVSGEELPKSILPREKDLIDMVKEALLGAREKKRRSLPPSTIGTADSPYMSGEGSR